jgi:starch phosphorylase
MISEARIAYFSMEIGLASAMPTYAGGLGVLAGDTIRSAADSGLPMVAISLLPRKGYFHQRLNEAGWQTDEPVSWPIDDYLIELPERVVVAIEGRGVQVRAWRYDVTGIHGQVVPVLFLDTERGLGPAPKRLPLRRRFELPARARSDPRDRWHSNAARPRLHQSSSLPYE